MKFRLVKAELKLNYRISSNNSLGRVFLFSHQKGVIIRGRLLFQILLIKGGVLDRRSRKNDIPVVKLYQLLVQLWAKRRERLLKCILVKSMQMHGHFKTENNNTSCKGNTVL